jgi:hypothetical protein
VWHPVEHLAGVGEVRGGRARGGAEREEPGDEGRVRGEAGLDGGGVELGEGTEAGAVREVGEERVVRRRAPGFGGRERGRRRGCQGRRRHGRPAADGRQVPKWS